MADVWLGRFSRFVEKLANAKGGPVIVDISHQISTMWPLSNGVENRYLESWNRFAVVTNVAAVAANFGRWRIRNPVGSNMMAVIEQLSFFSITGLDQPLVTWGAVTTDLTTLTTLTFTRMDPRGNPTPTAIVSGNAQAAGGQAFLQRAVPGANTVTDFINSQDQQIPILPGNAVDLQNGVANQGLNVTVIWRERPLEQSELA